MRNHIITDSPNCPIFRFDTLELTSRAISSLVFSFSFSSSFYHFSSRQQFSFLTPWRLSFLNAQSATPMFDGWWLQTGKKTGKPKMYFYSLLAPRQKLFFFFGHTRGSKKSNVKNKRQFFLSLSILTGSLPSVLGWLVAIFCVYVCLSWLTTDEQETIQQENSTLLEGRKRHEILPSDGRLCMVHLATHDRNSVPHSCI